MYASYQIPQSTSIDTKCNIFLFINHDLQIIRIATSVCCIAYLLYLLHKYNILFPFYFSCVDANPADVITTKLVIEIMCQSLDINKNKFVKVCL